MQDQQCDRWSKHWSWLSRLQKKALWHGRQTASLPDQVNAFTESRGNIGFAAEESQVRHRVLRSANFYPLFFCRLQICLTSPKQNPYCKKIEIKASDAGKEPLIHGLPPGFATD